MKYILKLRTESFNCRSRVLIKSYLLILSLKKQIYLTTRFCALWLNKITSILEYKLE